MKFTTPSIQRPLFAVLAVVATSLVITLAVRGSEPIDSGWSTPRRTTVFNTKHAENPQVRIAINHVLGQSQAPLLQAPARQLAVDETAEEVTDQETDQEIEVIEEGPSLSDPPIVFGNSGTSADGWRPAHLPSDSRGAAPHSRSSSAVDGPRFRPAVSSSASTVAPKIIESKTETVATTKPAPATIVDDEPAEAAKPPIAGADSKATRGKSTSDANSDAKVETNDTTPAVEAPIVIKPPAPPLPPLTQNQKNLRAKVRRVIKSYYTRPLNSRENDPWELMHGMLAYGVKSQIRQGSPQGKTITLVGWLCYNKPSKGFTLLYTTPENELRAKQGVGLQGHMGQFLAMLAQCQVSPDYPIRVRDQEFTIKDLIEAEKETCYPKSELTFKLIALMHYLDTDDEWVNDQGASWNIPRLIREELAQPIRGAACGGTHRLSGLSLAARTRVRRGEPLDGEYLRAAQFVEKYQNYAFQLQNRDGSLSTEWFRGRGDENDTDRRIKTTGHILEWLCYSLDDQQVRNARTFQATNYLATLLANNFNHDWEVGPLGHAIHALRLYDERVFQPYDGQGDVAKKPVRKTANRPSSSSRNYTHQF